MKDQNCEGLELCGVCESVRGKVYNRQRLVPSERLARKARFRKPVGSQLLKLDLEGP